MHYLTIPPNQKITRADGKVVELSFCDLLDEHVWGDPDWRQDEAWQLSWDRLTEQLAPEVAKTGVVIPIEDKDWEKFAPKATLAGKQLADRAFVRPVTRLTRAVTLAPTKDPRVKE